MNVTPPQTPLLRIPVRQIIFAFILAKLVTFLPAALLAHSHPGVERYVVSIGSTASMVLFVLLVMLGGRQPVRDVIAGTSPTFRPAGGVMRWAILAVLAGLAFRFGISGMGLGVLQLLDPDSISTGLQDLVTILEDPAKPLDALAFLLALLNATNEEIVYRRILQTYFCRRFGVAAGLLGVAAVFGAIHMSVAAAIMGLWMGLLYLYCGRVWVVAVAHAVTNLAVYLAANMQQPATAQLYLMLCYVSGVLMVAVTIFATLVVRKPPWRQNT